MRPWDFAVILLSAVGNRLDGSTVNGKLFPYLAVLIGISLLSQAVPHFQQDLSSF
jgi:hypothetical protein